MMTDNSMAEAIRNMRNRSSRLEHEGDYWNQDEKDRLVEMFETGVGFSEIAIRLQRTEPAVMQQVEKMDLFQRKSYPRRRKNGAKDSSCLCQNCDAEKSLCPRCTEPTEPMEDQ